MPRRLLIDVDVLNYEAGFAAQRTLYTWRGKTYQSAADWKAAVIEAELDPKVEKDNRTSHLEVLPESAAIRSAEKKLADIVETAGGGTPVLIMSGEGNYREEYAVTKGYKANRAAQPKPHHFQLVRNYYLEQGATLTAGIEADDAIGIEISLDPTAVVCSIDKDLNQLIGRHYDWNKRLKYKVDKLNGHRWFWQQMLTGDSTDNIPGLPGYGSKCKEMAALAAAQTIEEQRDIVLQVYNAEGMKLSYVNEQGILLWMQRQPNERWTLKHYNEEYANG